MADTQATPELLVVNGGLAVASVANPQGPFIHIVGFKVASGYGYEPQQSQDAPIGTVLYQGPVLAWQSIGDNTLDIQLRIPPEAGPFQFGEVALYLADANGQFSDQSVMFAIAAFDELQTKFSSLGTNVVSSYTFHCLLRLQQSVAVFQIDSESGPAYVLDVYQWSDVYPPGISANPDIPVLNVRELNEYGDASLCANDSDAQWSIDSTSYYKYQGSAVNNGPLFPVANASTSWIEIASNRLYTTDLGAVNRRFVIRTADGFFRSVSSVVVSGSNYRFNLNVSNDGTYNNYPLPTLPAVGSNVYIYRDDQAGGTIYWNQIINPPNVNPATLNNPGLATAGPGTYLSQPGYIAAQGLLHAPSQNTGRMLTGADDLNNMALLSGLYFADQGAYGQPANWPPTNVDGHIYYVNTSGVGGSASQLYIPFNIENPNATTYFRGWNSASNAWGPWTQMGGAATSVKRGGLVGLGSFTNGQVYNSGVLPNDRDYYIMNQSDCDASVYVNGVIVSNIGVGPKGTDAAGMYSLSKGDQFQLSMHPSTDWVDFLFYRDIG